MISYLNLLSYTPNVILSPDFKLLEVEFGIFSLLTKVPYFEESLMDRTGMLSGLPYIEEFKVKAELQVKR